MLVSAEPSSHKDALKTAPRENGYEHDRALVEIDLAGRHELRIYWA